MQIYAEKTQHFDIFRNTYWGGFKIPPNSPPEKLFENRDKFVKEFGIKSCCYSRTRLMDVLGCQFCDHIETYRTVKKQFIVVVSPYDFEPDQVSALACAMGFRLYAPMYHPKANTFVAIFKTGFEYRKAINAAKRIKRNGKA